MKRILLVVMLLAALPVAAQGAPQVNSLLLQALASPDGKAEGVMREGKIAEMFQGRTGSKEPVKVSVTTLKKFSKAGCSRLGVTLTQEKVPLRGGGEAPFGVRYEINLCRDGTAPTEGMDLSRFGQSIGSKP